MTAERKAGPDNRGVARPSIKNLPREKLPARIEPMLAKMVDSLPGDESAWGFEVKWDGVRALGFAEDGKWRMQNRRGDDITIRYPELEAVAAQLPDRSFVVDGEVVALDEAGRPSFQLIQRRMLLSSEAAVRARLESTPVDYMIFDLLHLDGHCVRELPYPERRALLDSLGLGGERWHVPSWHRGGGADLLEAVRRQGLEGIVGKRLDSPYRPGKRTGEWIKERVWQRQEFVIGGHIPGEGRRAESVGSLLVGYYDRRASELKRGDEQRLIFAGGAGSGLKQADLAFLTAELAKRRRPDSPFDQGAPRGPKAKLAVWCEPELVCEVQWSEWTHEGTLRQPSFKGMRDDKDPREVVREI
jgi:bifunctional non-homologous end joining protein LigD